jgi:hypothetical protein
MSGALGEGIGAVLAYAKVRAQSALTPKYWNPQQQQACTMQIISGFYTQ